MAKSMAQAKFTIDADVLTAFKARCRNEGVSMASQIAGFMKTGQLSKPLAVEPDMKTRRQRRDAVLAILRLLTGIAEAEEAYRDNIPEAFGQRYETADQTLDHLLDAVACLQDAY